MDDINFGFTFLMHVQDFVDHMENEFEMSTVGELTYFLVLQVKQLKNGICIS